MKEPELPIIPNYLSNPPFLYSKTNKDNLSIAQQNGTNSTHPEPLESEPATLSPTQEQQLPAPSHQLPKSLYTDSQSQQELTFVPGVEQNGIVPSPVVNGGLPMELSSEPHHTNHCEFTHAHPIAQNGPVCPSASTSQPPQLPSATISRQQSIPPQINCSQISGSMPAFQPFFFTSTFPVNVQGRVVNLLWCVYSVWFSLSLRF